MKQVPSGLGAHLSGEVTNLAWLIKVTRTDEQIVGITTHDADIVLDGVTYIADGSFAAKGLLERADLKNVDAQAEGLLDSAAIDEEALKAGLYDGARIDVYLCNWAAPEIGALHLRRGWLGDVLLQEGRYTAALTGLQDVLRHKIGETYTPECRFQLGDGRCGVDLSALSVTGVVTSLSDNRTFGDSSRSEADGYFTNAVLTWTSGNNAGASCEVCAWDAAEKMITLWLPPYHDIQIGDAYRIAPGCDKRFTTCRARFDNGTNYGGFPYLPGLSKILDYPDSK